MDGSIKKILIVETTKKIKIEKPKKKTYCNAINKLGKCDTRIRKNG